MEETDVDVKISDTPLTSVEEKPPPTDNAGQTDVREKREKMDLSDFFRSRRVVGILLVLVVILLVVAITIAVTISSLSKDSAESSWRDWSSWSECSVSCGTGQQIRSRECDTQGGIQCEGSNTQEQMCSPQCPTWSDWAEWSDCDAMCGSGTQERTRECLDPDSTGGSCMGQGTESQTCSSICAWAQWMNWAACDVTCGGGTRQRTRTCTNSNDKSASNSFCAGQPQESEACSNWPCPDCSRQCDVGVLNSDCNACECDSSTLKGFVHDGNNRPLSEVTIAYEDTPYSPLAVTDRTGTFQIAGVCAVSASIVATKQLYGSVIGQTTVVDATTSSIDIGMERLELPLITDHPRAKVRVVGENVAFCCNVTGNPTKYEWFKNGDILEGDGKTNSTLILTKLQTEDTGSYKCRASNMAGSVFSYAAALTVTDTLMGCNPDPIDQIVALPSDCIQPETNDTIYNVGACPRTQCGGIKREQTQCKDSEEFCCTVNQTETMTITCSGYEIALEKVISCGCQICEVLPIKISGKVVGASDNTPLIFGSVYMNNDIIATTDFNGMFSVELTTETTRVVLTFKDTYTNTLEESTKVLNVISGSDLLILVKMKNRPIPFQISSDVENPIAIAGEEGREPVANIVIPPNSVYDENGDSYTGPVNVYLTNFDVRNQDDLETVPGDFTAVDSSGEMMQLESYGVFALDFTGANGEQLSVGGSVPIDLDPSIVPALDENVGPDGVSEVKLWAMNTNTGSWEEVSELVKTTGVRGRRQANMFFGSLELSSGVRYNIDRISKTGDVCYAKVIPYATDKFLSILNNVQFSGVVEDTRATDPFMQNLRSWLIHSSSYGGEGFCVGIGCDSANVNRFNSFIVGTMNGDYLTPANATMQNSVPSKSTILSDLNFQISSGKTNDAIKTTANKNIVAYPKSNGPLYTLEEQRRCFSAKRDTYHFQFYVSTVEFGLIKVDRQSTPSPPFTPYAFYPITDFGQLPSNPCFIRMEINSPSSAVRVIARSYASNVGLFAPEQPPILYGVRELTLPKDNANNMIEACMEYKCGGQVTNMLFQDLGTDQTTLSIDIRNTGGNAMACRICTTSSVFKAAVDSVNPLDTIPHCGSRSQVYPTTPHSFIIPLIFGQNLGLYGTGLPLSSADSHDLSNCALGGVVNALSLDCN